MTVPIALAAISLFAAAVFAGLIGVVSAAIRNEDNNHALTSQAPGNLTRVGRRLTGLHVVRPLRLTPATPETIPGCQALRNRSTAGYRYSGGQTPRTQLPPQSTSPPHDTRAQINCSARL
jgi:hypothetical protein